METPISQTNVKNNVQPTSLSEGQEILLSGGSVATVSGKAQSTKHGHFIPTIEYGRVYAEKGTTFRVK